jgi:glycosyltransferase involved in cell wall biosynthesis
MIDALRPGAAGVRATIGRMMAGLRRDVGAHPTTSRRSDQTTVVLLSHDYGRYLRHAALSVASQTRVPRLLVVDDASTDETAEVVGDLIREGIRLDCLRLTANVGLARARNLAARAARTQWIVFLDADDWLAPGFVEAAETRLAGCPDVDVLTPDMTIVRDGRRPFTSRARVPSDWTALLRRNTIVQTSLVRRELVSGLGGYDPDVLFEDWDFWIRLLKAGHRIERLPGAFMFRREHGLNISKAYDQAQATRQVRERHPRPATRARSLGRRPASRVRR